MSPGPRVGEHTVVLRAGGVDERQALLLGGLLQFLTELHQGNPPAAFQATPEDASPARVASLKLRLVEGALRHLAAWLEAGPTPEELYGSGETLAAVCQERALPVADQLRGIADHLADLSP